MTCGVLARSSLEVCTCSREVSHSLMSLKHAILDEESKNHALATWDARWKIYIDQIVSSNGVL
jgi:hypothetical protein